MNEGYRLTDFSLLELSLLAETIDFKLNSLNRLSQPTPNVPYEKSTLIEMKTRVLTAFGIVSEREKELSN